MKNRRISKIKSKLYHKLKKREKDREEKKLIDYLEQIDPEAAEAYRMKEEQKKVEERLKLRHSSNNKFSKTLKRFGGMENEDLKEAFNDMMKEKNALKARTKTVKAATLMSSDEESSEDGSSDSSEDEKTIRRKAVSQIEKEL
jgi:U3 small nucleolar RNA-associated protein 14